MQKITPIKRDSTRKEISENNLQQGNKKFILLLQIYNIA